MACAIHGPDSLCGPGCPGFLYPAPIAELMPEHNAEAEALADAMLAAPGAPENVTPEDRAALVEHIKRSAQPQPSPQPEASYPAMAPHDRMMLDERIADLHSHIQRAASELADSMRAEADIVRREIERINAELAAARERLSIVESATSK